MKDVTMKRLGQTLKFVLITLSVMLIALSQTCAEDLLDTDSGIDKNGQLIVSPILALRCGLNSQNPSITSDCIDRLAYDYRSGKIVNDEFFSYEEEKNAIIHEYAAAYLKSAIEQLLEASGYEDRINKEMCFDSTNLSCASVSNDTREELEYNNKLAADNANIMIKAVRLRAQKLNFNGVVNILENVVPAKEVDLNKKELAGAP